MADWWSTSTAEPLKGGASALPLLNRTQPMTAHFSLQQPLVYIVDDDNELRTLLAWLLVSIGIRSQCCSSAEEFLAVFDPQSTACLVLDVRMPQTCGFELQAMLNQRGIALPTLFVSAHGDIPMAVRALQNGAIDFVEKPYNPQKMLDRIQAALKLAAQRQTVRVHRQQLQDKLKLLTAREQEVLKLVVDGKASKAIAHELQISVKTVDVHRIRIKEKLEVTSIAMLIRDVIDGGGCEC